MLITNEILNKNIPNKKLPERIDMAVCFWCCVQTKDKEGFAVFDYNPVWNAWYPFYDDKYKRTPILQKLNAKTYGELIEEYKNKSPIDIKKQVNLAKRYFKEIFNTTCRVEPLENYKTVLELKYSKTAKVYTIYQIENFIITKIGKPQNILQNTKLKCRIIGFDEDLNSIDGKPLVSNGVLVVQNNKKQFIKNSIKI